MSNAIDQIVNVQITLDNPPIDTKSYNHLCLVGPPPRTRRNADGTVWEHLDSRGRAIPTADIGAYASADEVKSFGWHTLDVVDAQGNITDAHDPIGGAARIVFTQSPAPNKLFIAVRKRAEYDRELFDCYTTNDVSELLGSEGEPEENATFLVAKYPASFEPAVVTKNGQDYSAAISVADDDTQYTIVQLNEESTGTFDLVLPESLSMQNKTIQLTYVVRWNSDAQDIESIQLVNDSDFEDIGDTLDRAAQTDGWYGLCPAGIAAEEFDGISAWVGGVERIAAFPFRDTAQTLPSPNLRTSFIYTGGEDFSGTDNEYINAAYMAKFLGYQTGSEMWENKTLQGIQSYGMSTTLKNSFEDDENQNYISYYIAVAGRNIVRGGKVIGNEWIDVIRFRDWLKNEIQLRIFTLMLVNPKIPYTDDGINMIKTQLEGALLRGQQYGGIAPDEYDEDGNRIPGFVTSVPLASSLTPIEKASRILKDCKFSARLAGAIRIAELRGALVYELPAETQQGG